MHLPTTLFPILATLLHTALSTPLLPRDDRSVAPGSTTVILGTFQDTSCHAGQKDYSGGMPSWREGDPEPFYGACQVLSGTSLKIWWTIEKSRCPILLFKDRACKEYVKSEVRTDVCIPTGQYKSWMPYCTCGATNACKD